MTRSWHEALTALGQRSPMPLAIGYVIASLASAALLRTALLGGLHPGLASLALALWLGAGGAVLLIVAWYRDEDTVPAAVLVALTVTIGGLVARVIVAIVMSRSVGAGVLLMMGSVIPLFIALLIAIPLSLLLVWVARRLAPLFGITPASAPRPRARSV